MSDGHDDAPPPQAGVGYGRPPAEHKFKPGKSGNPRGRPRKAQPAKIETGFGMAAINSMIVAEAYRPVTIREGEKTLELPAIQAVLRSMGVSAMKGNRFAQKALTEIVQKVEQENWESRRQHFEAMCEFKWKWQEEFERLDALGQPRPNIVPHPEDIVIDVKRGTAHVAGPFTEEDKVEWDRILECRDEMIDEIVMWKKAAKRKNAPEHIKSLPASLQRNVDRINSTLPKRYRKGSDWRIMNARGPLDR